LPRGSMASKAAKISGVIGEKAGENAGGEHQLAYGGVGERIGIISSCASKLKAYIEK